MAHGGAAKRTEPIQALVRSGFGISLLPDLSIRCEVKFGELRLIRIKEPRLKSRIAMRRRRTNHIPAPAATLIRLAKDRGPNRAHG
ncbi:MAG: hypothetical protein FJW36_19950 [Acidobacteria bacterium]|nr:hypothetical protein [Acidobacteriota bacterium]